MFDDRILNESRGRYEFIKNNNFQGLSLGLIRRFAIQLLASLRYLRKHRIIHCDLKPENILLKAPNKSGIKMIDFGSSCFEDERGKILVCICATSCVR